MRSGSRHGSRQCTVKWLRQAPCLVVDQIVLEAAEPDAVAAVDIARFEPLAQETADIELVPVGNKPLLPMLFACIKVAIGVAVYESDRKLLHGILPKRFALSKGDF